MFFYNPTQRPEATVHGCSAKSSPEKFHKNQRKTPAPHSIFIRLQALGLEFIKKGTPTWILLTKFVKCFETVFLQGNCEQLLLNISYVKIKHT